MRVYRKSLGLLLSSRLAYRVDFLFTLLSISLWSLSSAIFVILLYGVGAGYPDWQFYETLVFLGLFTMFYGFVAMIAFDFFDNVRDAVREGELELILIKPKDEIYLLLSKSFSYEVLGEVFVGVALLTIGLLNTATDLNLLLFGLYLIATMMSYMGFILIISSLGIRYIQVDRFMELLSNIIDIAEYPKNLFPKFAQFSLTLVLPIFIFSYYPASAVLGFEVQHPHLVIVSCFAFFLIALAVWKQTIKSYTGAGG